MAEIKNLTRLLGKLDALARAKAAEKARVVVGFTQNYGLWVHENLEARHPVGQAKFLEQPARELSNSGELGSIVRTSVEKGRPLADGLLLAGLRLQREAQLKTPVDTGALRASAFTRREDE